MRGKISETRKINVDLNQGRATIYTLLLILHILYLLEKIYEPRFTFLFSHLLI